MDISKRFESRTLPIFSCQVMLFVLAANSIQESFARHNVPGSLPFFTMLRFWSWPLSGMSEE